MSEAREKILRQLPFSGQRPTEALPDQSEVETALRECEANGIKDRDSGRVVAYAWYSGLDNDRVLCLVRAVGAKTLLLRELSCYTAQGERQSTELVSMLTHRGSPYNLAQTLGDPRLGWATAVISLVEAAEFDELISSLDSPQDNAHLICLYLLVTFVPPASRLPLTKKLVSMSDSFYHGVLIALVCRWVEDAVAFEENPIDAIVPEIEAAANCRIVVIGAAFDYVLRRFGTAQLPQAEADRLNHVWRLINDAGKRVIQRTTDIDTVLKQAGSRDLDVLAAISQWRNNSQMAPATETYIGKRAGDLLQRCFKSAMYHPEGEGPDVVYSERMINPLIHALTFDGIEVGVFRHLQERLASDNFSRMTRYGTWLNDRKRAVALIVIAGMVAKRRSDQALLSAVAQASTELRSQPSGSQPVLSPDGVKQVETELGFQIPVP
jgi:hypothetical protein